MTCTADRSPAGDLQSGLRALRVSVVFAVLGALAVSLALPTTAHAQAKEVASYQIAVRLDVEKKQLKGTERISFLNDTSYPADELYLHLYPNAFRSPDSTFMRENPAAARRASAENNWGGIDVTTLRLDSGYDLLAHAAVDDTVMRIPLPEPLPPGRTIRLDVEFSVQLVQVIARSGYQGDLFIVAQWFPKMAVLTDRGWNAHQYHANSEFFADFGNYRVEITLPERFVVGATGVPAGERGNGDGTRTLTFEAQAVHDFAWTANPTFREARTRVGTVEIRLLYLPNHEGVMDRFLNAAAAAVENFGRWYGPYPYPLLTVVDAPAGVGSGMEYPTFVTVESTDPPLPGVLLEEQVTIHEIAHQWWYGMVASNEFEEAWLDEGFATYSTRKLVEQLYGRDSSLGSLPGLRLGQLGYERLGYLSVRHLDPVVQDSWEFYSSSSYSSNVYDKADLILGTLEGYLGEETMGQVMGSYFQRFAFRHPTSQDFIDTVNQVSGRGFDRFLRQALYTPALYDYSVEGPAVSRRSNELLSRVEVHRLGDGIMPVDVVTTFEDGSQARETWDGESGWQRYEYRRPSPAIKVEVDPEHKLLLDTRWANNSATAWFNAEPIFKRAADLLWLAQGWLWILGHLIY